mmetsp:Transcript_7006/g.22191  ORF Transcript_7006/g.22191 Transcript_7006/m.22191 type:complete len:228 (-) Transcript_7006:348-1031(-)
MRGPPGAVQSRDQHTILRQLLATTVAAAVVVMMVVVMVAVTVRVLAPVSRHSSGQRTVRRHRARVLPPRAAVLHLQRRRLDGSAGPPEGQRLRGRDAAARLDAGARRRVGCRGRIAASRTHLAHLAHLEPHVLLPRLWWRVWANHVRQRAVADLARRPHGEHASNQCEIDSAQQEGEQRAGADAEGGGHLAANGRAQHHAQARPHVEAAHVCSTIPMGRHLRHVCPD